MNQWALCYRMGSGINTNMYVEAFHRVLKYVYLHGRVNRRLDTLVFTLLKFARDKAFDRLIKLSKGKAGINRLRMIHERHQTSSLMSPDCIENIGEDLWQIKSNNGKDISIYKVQRKNRTVVPCCTIACNQCHICIHQFSCTCLDFVVRTTICKHIHLVAATYAVHISQQDLVEQDPQLIQTEEPPRKDVDWETVVDSLGNDSIQHDVETVRGKCQDYLIDVSLQLSRCNSVHVLLSGLAKLREATALLSLPERCSGMANEANTSASAPANKKVTVQRTKAKIFSTLKQPGARSKIHLAKPTRQEKKEIERATLLSSWVLKKYKMPRKDHGILFLCWHLPILDIASILLQLYYICFVMKQPCLSLKEMVN